MVWVGRWVGGSDAWFALGAFIAAAPGRGVLDNALTGSGADVGLGVMLGSRVALCLRPRPSLNLTHKFPPFS
jgi:hypothetical protein